MKKLNTSIYSFEQMRLNDIFYVDKTEYLWKLIESAPAMYFLSRPRRFGKSLTLSTLKAVFEGKKELFKGLAIYDKPYDWKKYPVIHLDLNGRNFTTVTDLKNSLRDIVAEQARISGVQLEMEDPAAMLQKLIAKLSVASPVVLLLDEYDKPILNNITEPDTKGYLRVLKFFYSVIKEKSEKIHFVFVTGVTKFCHVSLFSDLNNLTDISMNAEYAAMLGYTQKEFEENFKDRITETESLQKLPHAEYLAEIKDWYDGYRFEENAESVYNPVSIANFFNNHGKFNNYWFSTGTPAFLMELTKSKNFDFESAMKESVPEIAFSAFEIGNIDPLTLLFQTGYITIKNTEQRFGQTWYFLDFPNREVSSAFSAYILNSYAEKTQTGVVKFTAEIATALTDGDLERLRKAMEVFFAGIPYQVHKKNEATFHAIFFALFRLLGEFIEAESCTNDGRIDAVVQTEKAVYLFEFKLDNNPTALSQIKEKKYFRKYLLDKREIHLTGVNFDTQSGNLIGWETEQL